MISAHTDSQPPRMLPMEHWFTRCESCGHVGDTYDLSDFDGYGRAIGRTYLGELAEFNAWEDPVYEELLGIVRTFILSSGQKRRECFNEVMTWASDPAPSGERYKFIHGLYCRQCRSKARWLKLAEPLVETIHLPLVTHREWENMSREERSEMIEAALRSQGCIQ